MVTGLSDIEEAFMETCVKKNCPFIPYCRDYRLAEDKGERCKTQEAILKAAEKLQEERHG